jgi:hypothetical protein
MHSLLTTLDFGRANKKGGKKKEGSGRGMIFDHAQL